MPSPSPTPSQPAAPSVPGRAGTALRPHAPVAVLLVVVMVAAAVAAAGSRPARAQGDTEAWDRTPALLDTTTGPDGELPVTLDYDLYVPEGASASDPRPAMVVAHGFGNAKDVAEMTTLAAFFAGRGYVVIASTHQGFGGSSGCIALDSIDVDARNVSSLIDVLAARDDVLMDAPGDPRVGMVGGSYGGGHQGGVAASDPRLDAISPGRTWHSLQHALNPNGLVGDGGLYDLQSAEQGVFKATWTSLFFTLGTTQPAMGNGGCDPATQQTLYPGQPPCPGFDPRVCPIFASLRGSGDVTQEQRDFVARSSVATFVEDVDIPVLLTQGQSDTLFTVLEATATAQALLADGNADVHMVWNNGGHGYAPEPGEGEPYSGAFDDSPESQALFRQTYFAERYARFFDHHLRGVGTPGPRFAFYPGWLAPDEGGPTDPAEAPYVEVGTVPTNDGRTYLLADAGLAPLGGPPVTFEATVVNPPGGTPAAHSETPNFSGEGQPGASRPPAEVPGQHVALDSPPLSAAAVVVGFPTVRVGVANANGQDAVLFTKLYDVAPDGTATLLRRTVAASRIPAADLPGTVTLRVPGVAHRFEAGHAVRLVIATTDDSYRNAAAPDQVTLSSDPADPAVLDLPLEGADHIGRLAGPDRVATAVALSERAFPEADAAVIAAAGTFADALSAGPLAVALGGPLLLTDGAALDPRVLADLRRLAVSSVTLVGGEAALSPAVADALADAGIEVSRLGGRDRFATSIAIAEALAALTGAPFPSAVVARGDGFADALAAGSLAATRGIPVVLVDAAHVDDVAALIEAVVAADAEVVVAGGPSAVAEDVAARLGRPARRLAGPDRYATAAALSTEAVAVGARPEPLLLASGATFPDALAAVPAAHRLGGMAVVVPPARQVAGTPMGAFLEGVAGVADTLFAVGGGAVLPAVADDQIAAAVVAG